MYLNQDIWIDIHLIIWWHKSEPVLWFEDEMNHVQSCNETKGCDVRKFHLFSLFLQQRLQKKAPFLVKQNNIVSFKH